MTKILKVVGASWLQTKISSYVLGILGVLAILALFVGQIERIQEDGNYAATVFYSEKTGYRIEYWGQSNELADIPKGAARAYFRMDVETTGWSLLEVETNPLFPDEIQAYAAGIVEGALTWSLIHNHLENTIRERCDGTSLEKQCNKLRDALDKSVDIWKSHADERGSVDPFWHQVSLYYIQISGIFTGWKHGVERSQNEYDTDISDLYWLNSVGEVTEIQHKLNISLDADVIDALPDLSSGFLRIANETVEGSTFKKIYLAQNKAASYTSMTRILKRYKLNYHQTSKNTSELVPGLTVDFSGYPGSVTSQDEFYFVKGDHRLAISGISLKNYNDKLWKEVNITHQVPLGPRVHAANHLAQNVSSWAHILASSNSGTGSKQWLVVDFDMLDQVNEPPLEENHSRHINNYIVTESTITRDVKHTVIHANSSINRSKGLAWLVEQVPGRTHSADLSEALLVQGYWATYGLPFFNDISEDTQIHHMEKLYGNVFSEAESPRAVLFKRGFKNATSLDSIVKLMRQNNVTAINRASNETDCDSGLSCMIDETGYWSVLGVRGDMVHKHKEAYGIIDTKVISGMTNQMSTEFNALSGPPYTKINTTKFNKGNVAPIYTHQFDNKPSIDGLEIRDLVKHQIEEARQEDLEYLNRDVIKPFQWSESEYKDRKRLGLPDNWAFQPIIPKWSW
ncbi:hypothetical protein evm_003200 [Chilo suppressalis]|nr:hypothetical protein evm_003200 [Chilo suppressalis]